LIYYIVEDSLQSKTGSSKCSNGTKRKGKPMRRLQAWQYLIVVFAVFWVLFAVILIIGDFPFLVISMALTTLAMLSLAVVALAWAFQNDW